MRASVVPSAKTTELARLAGSYSRLFQACRAGSGSYGRSFRMSHNSFCGPVR
jgi:hypothetical protein